MCSFGLVACPPASSCAGRLVMPARSQTHPRAGVAFVACVLLIGCAAPDVQDRSRDHFSQSERRLMGTQSALSLADQAGSAPRGSQAAADLAARAQSPMPVVRKASKPWLGAAMVPATSEDLLPSVFTEPFVLDFTDLSAGGSVSLQVVAARLSRLSGVPVRLSADVFTMPGGRAAQRASSPLQTESVSLGGLATRLTPAVSAPIDSRVTSGAGAGPSMPTARQVGGGRVLAADVHPTVLSTVEPLSLSNVEMRWNGTLAGYLNMVTDSLGLAWEFRDNTVVIMRFVHELHEIVAFAGATRFALASAGSGSLSGGGSGASNAASASMEVSEAGVTDALSSIEKTVQEMLADTPGSTVVRTDGSGRLMVKTTRDMQSRVRDYIRAENMSMRRQAAIQFDVYSVTVDESDQRGVNWFLILQKAGQAVLGSASMSSTLAAAQVGSASLTVLPGIEGNRLSELLADSSVLLQALNQQGYNAQHRPISLLTLNRQWARVSRNSTEYYLSETTPGPAGTTGAGAPGLKTDKVTTGDQYVAMPQILADNTILLKFGISLSDLLGLFDVSVGSGNQQQKVQAPKVQAINAQFPVALKPGEIVVVTGLSRTAAVNDDQRLIEGAPLWSAGTRKSQLKREHFIVFVRPTLM